MKTSDQTTSENHELVTLFVKVAAKTESQQKAEDALLADLNGARTEEGNFKMELYKIDHKPDHFYLFERWRSQDDLEFHFKQPYTQGAFNLQKSDLSRPIEMNYLQDLWPVSKVLEKQIDRRLTTLIVPFETKPGYSDAFVSHFEKFVPLVRKEQGNVEFHFHRVIGSENRFVLYERWEAQADLDVHNQLPGTARLLENITPLLTRPVIDFVLFAKDIS